MSLFSRRPAPDPATGIAANGRPRESVWDYPRPPRVEPVDRRVRVALDEVEIARTDDACRVLETAGAPAIYIPSEDVAAGFLRSGAGSSFCEWKGRARYFDVVAGDEVAPNAAWSYPEPTPAFATIRGWVSFYPGLLDCYLDDERVVPQPGGFYGGWVTAEICGPIKGVRGSAGW